jgi:hypothetical protein
MAPQAAWKRCRCHRILIRNKRITGWDTETLMTHPKVLAEAKRRIEASKAAEVSSLLLKL